MVDTNVVIDIFDRDPIWYDWSLSRLTEAAASGATINAIILAELSRNFDDLNALRFTVHQLSLTVEVLDDASAFAAGKAFQQYLRDRSDQRRALVLPDFLIGAHALTLDKPLLTRDPRLYRRYFPELPLITPETHP